MNLVNTIGYEDETCALQALQLAQRLDYPLDKDAACCLFVSRTGLALKVPNFSLLYADFSLKLWSKRKSEGKKQGLVRACKPAHGLRIIDATAGWGRDAAILASLGAEVLMLERHPLMAALLMDAIDRRGEVDKQQIALSLKETDAYTYLNQLNPEQYPHVIYIDPMHPERHKSALVKKDMQILQQMIGADTDVLELIELAMTRCQLKVVVKWPQKLKPLLSPAYSIEGKTVRFDVYLSL